MWPRRDARSVNNPPAHPTDERRRAESGVPPILPNPPSRGPRHPPRPCGLLTFFLIVFPSPIFLSKWLFFGLSRDLKIDPKPPSGPKVGSPSKRFWLFFGRSCFCRVFLTSGDQFSMIFRLFFRCIFRCLCLLFPSRRTFKSIGRDNTFSYFQVLWFLQFF